MPPAPVAPPPPLAPTASPPPAGGASGPVPAAHSSAGAPPDAPPDAPPHRACANCGAPAPEAYCPRCGQETRSPHRSIGHLAGEALDDLLGWDGKIPRTLWVLVTRPGRLTMEYLAGRRARYVRPLRLYLTASVLLLLALSLGADDDGESAAPAATPAVAVTPRAAGAGEEGAVTVTGGDRRGPGNDLSQVGARRAVAELLPQDPATPGGRLGRAVLARYDRLARRSGTELSRAFKDALLDQLGNAVFAMLPVFALLLRLLYWRRPLWLAEHFVFALHVHTVAMLALLGATLAPGGWALAALLWAPAYLWAAMRRVYGGSVLRTTASVVLLALPYGLLLGAAILVAVVGSVLAHA